MKLVYGILPAFIEYTDDIADKKDAAITSGCHIKIRPSYRDDVGLLQHELQHVRQFYRRFLFMSMTHLEREIEAYRVQLKYYPDDRAYLFAQFMATSYPDFTIAVGDAYLRLKA